MIFFCFLFWTPKSFISPDILCHILFWCVRTAFLVWSSTMFNQAIWEHGLSLLEFWASWKFDSRGRLIHACRNMMKYVAFNRVSLVPDGAFLLVQSLVFPWRRLSQLIGWFPCCPQTVVDHSCSLHNWTAGCEWLWEHVFFLKASGYVPAGRCGPCFGSWLTRTKIIQNHPKSGFDFAEVHVGLVGSWHRHFCFHDLWNLFDQGWVSWYHMLKQESAAWSLLCSLERSDSLTECQAGSSSWKS